MGLNKDQSRLDMLMPWTHNYISIGLNTRNKVSIVFDG